MCIRDRYTIWLKHNALKRNRKFAISWNDIYNVVIEQKGCCKYTGLSVSLEAKTFSIDRIDNNIDYYPYNITLVHKHVNVSRCDNTLDEFKNWCKLINDHYIRKNLLTDSNSWSPTKY